MVPGSTFKYGSILIIVTLSPLDSRSAPKEAAAIPFPWDETTPPVINTNLVKKTPTNNIDDKKNHNFLVVIHINTMS